MLVDQGRTPLLSLRKSLCAKRLFAQRADVVFLTPLLDAVRVEVVPLVARKRRNHVIVRKRHQANDAFLVLTELGPIEYARQLAQVLRHRRLSLQRATIQWFGFKVDLALLSIVAVPSIIITAQDDCEQSAKSDEEDGEKKSLVVLIKTKNEACPGSNPPQGVR